jgi:guanylate kinase
LNEHQLKSAPGLLVVVSAPSGAGKTSVCRRVMELFPDIHFSVSVTTREPRPGEKEGRDYHFVSVEEFRTMIARDEFIEWVENYGNFYGTSKKTMDISLGRGYDLLLDIEPRGAKEIRKHYPRGVFVFILPPSIAELRKRLAKRGEGEEALKRRLKASLSEIKEAMWYDYIVVNEKLKDAVERFRAIYLAEKSRRDRCTNEIDSFLKQQFSQEDGG